MTLLALAVLGLAGCTDYGIVTTIGPDGSGTRIETVRVTADGDGPSMSPERYVYLLGLGEDRGWTHRTEVDDDTTHVFERRHRVAKAGDWDRLSGSILVHGTTAELADERVGRVRLGDVEFSNVVRVSGSAGSPGPGDTVTYRESFSWSNGATAFVEAMAVGIPTRIEQDYPRLSSEQKAELAGLVRAGMWSAIEAGLLDSESEVDEDLLFERFTSRTAELSADVVRPSYPSVRPADLDVLIRDAVEDDDGILGRLFKERLPGLDLAGTLSLEIRLVPAGRVLESNAESVAGDTLVWELDAWDALARPVETVATFLVGGAAPRN
jgi:hypothetical protein